MRFNCHQFRLDWIILENSFLNFLTCSCFFFVQNWLSLFSLQITKSTLVLARIWKKHLLYKRQRHTLTPSGRYLTRRADSLTSLIFNVAACADFGYFLPRSNLAFSGFKGSAICRSYCCIFQIFKILTESVKNDVLKN